MKKTLIIITLAAAALSLSSCAKNNVLKPNDISKRYLDSWLKIYHPDAKLEADGIYLLNDTPGTGQAIGDVEAFPYLYLTYTKTDLDGNITETTDAKVAQQIGTYDKNSYYGPIVKGRSKIEMTVGQEMMFQSMKIGGTRTAMIPGWFETTTRHKKVKEYFEEETGTDAIFTVTVVDAFKDIRKWQADSIENYIAHNFNEKVDSTKYGYYYIQTKAPDTTESFEETATVYINYTGSLLNGTIFDTTVEDRAKDGGLYSKTKSYEPVKITLAKDHKDLKLNGNNTIEGFSYCISQMKKGEKGTVIFISKYGYDYQSQNKIPSYSPLRFDVEMIGTEEE